VKPARRNTDERVTLAHTLRAEDSLALHRADEEAGDVVRAVRVHPGHLRRLAAK
jgi:hypothetical protein